MRMKVSQQLWFYLIPVVTFYLNNASWCYQLYVVNKITPPQPPVPVSADKSIASPDSLCTNAG